MKTTKVAAVVAALGLFTAPAHAEQGLEISLDPRTPKIVSQGRNVGMIVNVTAVGQAQTVRQMSYTMRMRENGVPVPLAHLQSISVWDAERRMRLDREASVELDGRGFTARITFSLAEKLPLNTPRALALVPEISDDFVSGALTLETELHVGDIVVAERRTEKRFVRKSTGSSVRSQATLLRAAVNGRGDINGDGLLTLEDWVLAGRVVVKLETDPILVSRADIDRDGQVDILDWVRVGRLVVGLPVEDTSSPL